MNFSTEIRAGDVVRATSPVVGDDGLVINAGAIGTVCKTDAQSEMQGRLLVIWDGVPGVPTSPLDDVLSSVEKWDALAALYAAGQALDEGELTPPPTPSPVSGEGEEDKAGGQAIGRIEISRGEMPKEDVFSRHLNKTVRQMGKVLRGEPLGKWERVTLHWSWINDNFPMGDCVIEDRVNEGWEVQQDTINTTFDPRNDEIRHDRFVVVKKWIEYDDEEEAPARVETEAERIDREAKEEHAFEMLQRDADEGIGDIFEDAADEVETPVEHNVALFLTAPDYGYNLTDFVRNFADFAKDKPREEVEQAIEDGLDDMPVSKTG